VLGNITLLLERWHSGDSSALDELIPLIYNELRKLAQANLRRKGQAGILEPTALVHEVWLKLSSKQQVPFHCRGEFFGLASRVMRDMLVDRCRRQRAAKRGGSTIEIPLDDANAAQPPVVFEFLVLDDALTRLASIKPRCSQIIEMRFFGGLTMQEVAEVLCVSKATAEREWNFARLWLARDLGTHPSAKSSG
jgi:RNA polymerase sigma factor (TIGR02999 family)